MTLTVEIDPKWRRIGPSDLAAILGICPYRSATEVWERIVHGRMTPAGEAAEWGTVLEPVIARTWARRNNKRVVPGRMHQSGSIWRAQPDAEVLDDPLIEGLEIKTAGLREAHNWGEQGSDEIPEHYLCQVQGYMELLDCSAWAVAALIGGQELRSYVVIRNRALGENLREAGERFWRDFVQTGRPPIDASDACRDAIVRMLPRNNGSLRAPTDEESALALAYRDAKREVKAATARAGFIGNQLRVAIGDADGLEGAWGKLYFRASKPKTGVDFKAIAMLHLATLAPEDAAKLLAAHTKTATEPVRPLKPYFKGEVADE